MNRWLLVFVLMAVGCAGVPPGQAVSQAETANALMDLRLSFDSARSHLLTEVDRLPVEAGLAVLDLDEEVQRYRDELSAVLSVELGAAAPDLQQLYLRGRRLYAQGDRLLLSHLDELRPATRYQLRSFAHAAARVDALYSRIMANPTAQAQYAQAQLELVTLAVRLGMLLL